MIPVWLIAAIALLGAVCLALPLHIGMTGVCLLLLAAVLLALMLSVISFLTAPEYFAYSPELVTVTEEANLSLIHI